MQTVIRARPYRANALGSLDRTQGMLIRQYQFPFHHEDDERTLIVDHDRLMEQHAAQTDEIIRRHSGRGEMALEDWFRKASDSEIMSFLVELVAATIPLSRDVPWTGFRIVGGVHGQGYPVWTLQLFAKRPDSKTEVYTGENAPNVIS